MQHLKSRRFCHYLPAILILMIFLTTQTLKAMGPDPDPEKQTFLEKALAHYEESLDVEWSVERAGADSNTFRFRIIQPERWQAAYLLINDKKTLTLTPGKRTLTYNLSYLGDGEHELCLLVLDRKHAGVAKKEIEIKAAGKGILKPSETE